MDLTTLKLSSALAALCVATALPASAEVQISAYSGLQDVMKSDVGHSALGKESIDWEGKSMSSPAYWGLRAVWWRWSDWGLGFEVNHAKAYAKNKKDAGYDTLEFTDGLNLVTLNLFRRWQVEGRAWTPYVGAGLGVTIPHVEVTPVGGKDTFEYQLAGPAVQAVAGVSYALNHHWSVFGEYKGSWSHNDVDLKGGDSLKTDLVTNAVNLGLSYSF